ncbi:hypothetical protein [Pseudomonas fluorescens]|uniref:hypothetical protein n=1 Tax=Pseudomonas fluorescens TaxID=294 RepID=UPI0011B934B5|nr:hypothetical protein [Pseudomonas fluorescens]
MLIFPGSTSMHPMSVMQPATTKRAPAKAPAFIQACAAPTSPFVLEPLFGCTLEGTGLIETSRLNFCGLGFQSDK